jgi:hypothetical protein
MRPSLLCTVLLTLITASAAPAGASPLTFADDTFDLTNYTITTPYVIPTGVAVTTAQCATCGVGGTNGLDVTALLDGPSAFYAAVGLVSNLWLVDPAVVGPIASIDASVEKNLSVYGTDVPSDVTGGNTFRPLVYQGGTYYMATVAGPSIFLPAQATSATTGYQTLARSGLQPIDFLSFDFSTGAFGLASPDFTQPFSLGLGQISAAFGFSDPQVTAQYDGLVYQINTIPEPGTLLLVATGVAAGLQRRRRARA